MEISKYRYDEELGFTIEGTPAEAEMLARCARECSRDAVRRAFAAGLSITVVRDGNRIVPEIERARRELGLVVGVPLDLAIRATVKEWRPRRSAALPGGGGERAAFLNSAFTRELNFGKITALDVRG